MTDKLLIICGATASGKSGLSIKCAQKFNGEIVSCDSMQIYKGMNIGTAKVTIDEMQGIRHHLIDIVEPNANFSVAEYKELAQKAILDIKNRGKLPILVGGTGLYINSLIYDYTFSNATANSEIRNKYKDILAQKGAQYLHSLLNEISPKDATRLHPNDTFRVIRALEVAQSGNLSADTGEIVMDYNAYAIDYPRDILYDRINERVDIMFRDGLKSEVESLLDKGVNFDCQSMKAIGYKEFYDYFYNGATLEEVSEKIKKNSRNYAKRQLTWFRKMPNLTWCNTINDAINIIEENI